MHAELRRVRHHGMLLAGVVSHGQAMNTLSIGVTTGCFWHSQLEFAYTYDFDILRKRSGGTEAGERAILPPACRRF